MAGNTVNIDVLLAIEEANKRLQKVEKGISDLSGKATGFFGKMNAVWSSFVGNLASQVVMKAFSMAAAGAKKLFDVFIVDGIQAAKEQEEAINRMNVALAQTGQFSIEASRSMQLWAESIQASSTFSDEAVLSNAAMLQSLTQLDINGLQKASASAVELAATFDMDLQTAMTAVGKAVNGEMGQLGRMGIEIQAGATKAENLSNVLNALARFTGSAESKTRTYAGALAQAKNQFGELLETTGAFIVKNPVVITLINQATRAFADLNEWVLKNKDLIFGFVNGALVALVSGLGHVLGALDLFIRGFQFTTIPMQLFINSTQAVAAVLMGDFEEAKAQAVESLEDLKRGFGGLGKDGPIGEAGEALLGYAEKLDEVAKRSKGAWADNTENAKKALQKQGGIITAFEDFYTGTTEEEGKERQKNFKDSQAAIIGLMGSSNKEFFAIGKAAALATATVDGVVAVQKALASAPFPFNIAMAAAVGIAQGVNIAKIAAQQPPKFADGGIVPGSSFQGDNVVARVNSGEMVLNMDQQRSLFEMLRGGASGGGGTTINVNIGGNVDSEDRITQIAREVDRVVRFRNVRAPGFA